MLYLDRGCHGQSQPPCGVQPLLRQMLQGVQRQDRLLQITQQVGRGHTRAQCPQTPTSPWRGFWSGLLSWDGQGSHGPRSAARTWPGSTALTGPVSVLLEPRGTGTPLEPCQKTQWWQARLAGADMAPGTGGDRFVRLPVLFRPCQNLKRRKWHQVHFTDKKTEVEGTKAGRGL